MSIDKTLFQCLKLTTHLQVYSSLTPSLIFQLLCTRTAKYRVFIRTNSIILLQRQQSHILRVVHKANFNYDSWCW